jgi:putative nucleotidyltransferase with HDIG domain
MRPLSQLSGSFKALSALLALLSAAAFCCAVILAPPASTLEMAVACVVLSALALIAESLAVEFTDRITLTASNLPILLAIMFLGPAPAMIVAAVAGLWGFWRERSVFIALFNVSDFVAAAGAAAVVFLALENAWGFAQSAVSVGFLAAGVLAAATYEFCIGWAVGLASLLMYQRSLTTYWKAELGPFARSLAVLWALGLMTAALYAEAGLVAVVLLFVPLFASQYMFKLLANEKEHVATQKQLSDQYLEMNIGLAAAMVVLLDSKDEYTAQHSAAVAMYCRDIAGVLGLPEQEAEALHLAGLLHDLGKVGTPDAVLGKQTTLDEDDWDFIRQHPGKGAEVLSHLAAYQDVADIVQYHHERLDGSGYPDGVAGDRIPELSKILAVADSYHAMTSDRPYRAARSSFDALKELRKVAGVTLDARYIEVLAAMLRDKDLAYREGRSTDFMGEYERGRINLRLRGKALADLSGLAGAREDPAAG